ncbi:hypothetical protein DRN67_02150 [Candidatus Micrarchaeota archaeon]|nr:MAG: hypothetical protein DRN67_02150 [Candidatus Micrarchaeota archaeon]
MLSFFVLSLMYMLGRLIRSPTLDAWIKIELYQVILTILFVSGASFVLSTACAVDLSFFQYYLNLVDYSDPQSILPSNFEFSVDLFEASSIYLDSLQQKVYGSATEPGYYQLVKSVLMKWEVQVTRSEFKCPLACLIMPNGWSIDPGAGFYARMGAGYLALQTLVISTLSISSLRYMLEYASNGALLYIFPIGALFRSIPYMRGFGGALLALAVVLYLGLPFILFVNALLAYGIMVQLDPAMLAMPADCLVDGKGDCTAPMARMAATAAFTTVFMPALDFIFLVAFGRELSRIFGSELDLSRISQLV